MYFMQSPYNWELWVLNSEIKKAQDEYNKAVSNARLFDSISNSNQNKIKALANKKAKESYLNSLIVKQWQLQKANDIFLKNQWDNSKTDVVNPNESNLNPIKSTSLKSTTYNNGGEETSKSKSTSNNTNAYSNIDKTYNDQLARNEKSFSDARTGLWLSAANRSAFNFWGGEWVSAKVIAQNMANVNNDIFDKLSALWIQKENLNSQLLWQKVQALQNQQQLDQNKELQDRQVQNQERQMALQEDQYNMQKAQYEKSLQKPASSWSYYRKPVYAKKSWSNTWNTTSSLELEKIPMSTTKKDVYKFKDKQWNIMFAKRDWKNYIRL